MAFRSNIGSQIRGFYFASSGNDNFSGQSLETPKLTMQAAIDAAAGLSPPPSATDSAFATVSQGGTFSNGFILPDFVTFDGNGAILTTFQPVSIQLGSSLRCTVEVVVNAQAGGVCWDIDGQSSLAAFTFFTGIFGANGIGYDIKGTVNDIFCNSSQVTVAAPGGIGFKVTSGSNTPIDINSNVASLTGDNSIYIHHDTVNASDTTVVDISSISDMDGAGVKATGVIAIQNLEGHLVITAESVETSTVLDAQGGVTHLESGDMVGDIILANSGTVASVTTACLIGDITVGAGCTLTCDILEHTGTLTNNGTINGTIGGQDYGTFLPQSVLVAKSVVNQNPTGLDAPLQVEFGAAQGTVSDPVMIDALGTITVNVTGRYRASLFVQYGRTGAGAASWLFFRGLKNGTQNNLSVLTKLDNANSDLPMHFEVTSNLEAGDFLKFEMIRDSQGFDSGGLFSETPTPVGWLVSPSAQITMIKE